VGSLLVIDLRHCLQQTSSGTGTLYFGGRGAVSGWQVRLITGTQDTGIIMYPDRKRSMYGGRRRKICRFCENRIDYIDFKEDRVLRRFVTERGKIVPRRISGNCARHQRKLTRAIKRSRHMAITPYVSESFR